MKQNTRNPGQLPTIESTDMQTSHEDKALKINGDPIRLVKAERSQSCQCLANPLQIEPS